MCDEKQQRITTRIVVDIATGAELEHEWYWYSGHVDRLCGASSQQTQIEASQAAFYDTLTSEYKTVFGQNQAILGTLTKSLEPILAGGINQQGFSPAELANLNNIAVNQTGQNYANAKSAISNQQGAEGGGNSYIPSGAKEELQSQLATSAVQQESSNEQQIQSQNYATGRENYLGALSGLSNVAGQYNPTGFANSATGAGGAAASTADAITQANNSWLSVVSGVAGAAGTAYAGR